MGHNCYEWIMILMNFDVNFRAHNYVINLGM